MNPLGLVFLAIGVIFILYPERIARNRLSGAKDPTPTQGAIDMVRYVGGPLLVILGFFMAFVTIQ